MNIPLVDLLAQHNELRFEIDSAIKDVIDNSCFIGGPPVQSFERHFAAYCEAKQAVACASGTDALKLALMACGVGSGEEVITVPNTFIATVEAIIQIGAFPVLVDIDGPTYNMSPDRLREFLETGCRLGRGRRPVNLRTNRTVAAFLPVHLYGLPADMAAIWDLAEHYNLPVIEDACQAHGARCMIDGQEKRVGSIGSAAAFSFYPGKNLGAMGEGGAVTTGDRQKARNMRIWRDHGQSKRYVHVSPDGWNGRLDALQCAILDIKLRKLDHWNERRAEAAKWYRAHLAANELVTLPTQPEGRTHVYHLFVVRVPDRDRVWKALSDRGIGVGLHYPTPLHKQEAYRDMGWRQGHFPASDAAASSVLSLPMFPHITEEQVDFVCQCLKDVLQ